MLRHRKRLTPCMPHKEQTWPFRLGLPGVQIPWLHVSSFGSSAEVAKLHAACFSETPQALFVQRAKRMSRRSQSLSTQSAMAWLLPTASLLFVLLELLSLHNHFTNAKVDVAAIGLAILSAGDAVPCSGEGLGRGAQPFWKVFSRPFYMRLLTITRIGNYQPQGL